MVEDQGAFSKSAKEGLETNQVTALNMEVDHDAPSKGVPRERSRKTDIVSII